MSRDYDVACPDCDERARQGYVCEGVQVKQCLNEECGAIYGIFTMFKRLRTKGVSEASWDKAVKGAKKCKNCRAVDEVLGVKP